MQQATPRNQRNKRLHVVYFVDAARTKSFSVSLRTAAVGACATAAVLVGAGASLFASARLAVQVKASEDYVRELKRGILAQSVAFEHVLSGTGSDDEKAALSRTARDLEREIAANADAPVRAEGRRKRPLDLAKVTNGLSNLDAATLNLVAAGAADRTTSGSTGGGATGSGSGTGAGNGASGASAGTGNTGNRTNIAPSGAPSRIVASADAEPARAGAPGVANAGGKFLRAAPLVSPDSLPGSGSPTSTASAPPPPLSSTAASPTAASAATARTSTAASARDAAAKVTFDHVSLLPISGSIVTPPTKDALDASSASEGRSSAGEEPEDDGAADSASDTSASPPRSPVLASASTRVRFTLTNHDQSRVLTGRVCLVALLGDAAAEGSGTGGILTIPPGLSLPAGPRSNPEGCPGGQLVRFSRLRPTEMVLTVAPARIRRLVLHFSEGPGSSHHSLAWTAPTRVPPPR